MTGLSFSNRSLSLGDEEIPILFDGLFITKEQAASMTEEEVRVLMQKWGENMGMSISQEPEQDSSGYVYLARTETVDHGAVHKIGRSKEPADRVQVFDTKMPVDVEIVNHFPVDDSVQVESILQSRHDTQHIKGEWFDLDEFSLAGLRHATGFEDGELTYSVEALKSYATDIGQMLLQKDDLLDDMAEDLSSRALSAYMKWSVLNGPDGLGEKLVDHAGDKGRTEALARFLYWGEIEMRPSPPEEWEISSQRLVETVLSILNHHPDLNHTDTDDDRMESLAEAFFRRYTAAPEEMLEIISDVTGSQKRSSELVAYLMPHHPELDDAHFGEQNVGSSDTQKASGQER